MEGRSRSTFKFGGHDMVMAAGKASVRAVIVAIRAARLDDSILVLGKSSFCREDAAFDGEEGGRRPR